MDARAIVLEQPESLKLAQLPLSDPGCADAVVEIDFSGVSTGTEKLLWSGRMPPFPGMGYPLVPGYESVGTVVEAGPESGRRPGDRVFVPGATCYGEVRGLFGGSASRVVAEGARLCSVDRGMGVEATLLALAATARHAIAGPVANPDLIVGHGVLGRLVARMVAAIGAPPTVWEVDPARMDGARGYPVLHPDDDPRRDYRAICDVSGDATLLDSLIGRLAPGGEIVLAGFYADRIGFAFPPAFMKEARFRIAAEWKPDDLTAARALVEEGFLDLGGLITHTAPARDAPTAYPVAFSEPTCLKMILDWRAT